jgi:short-subunit dehydrogenase
MRKQGAAEMRLEGAVAVDTGAGSGLGRALAAVLASRGARLLLAGRREATLEETRAALPQHEQCRIVVADVATRNGRAALCAAAQGEGRLDLLVNNAGLLEAGPLSGLRDERLESVIATNLVAPIALARDLLPLLRKGREPRIVNIGSVLGDIGHPLFAAYCASKFGLRGASDALRRELAHQGVGVTYAAPRALRTEASDRIAGETAGFEMRSDCPQTVAARIVEAAARGRASVYAAGPERLFVLAQRLAPRLVDGALDKAMRKREASRIGAAASPE